MKKLLLASQYPIGNLALNRTETQLSKKSDMFRSITTNSNPDTTVFTYLQQLLRILRSRKLQRRNLNVPKVIQYKLQKTNS